MSTKTTNKYKILNKNDLFVAMNDSSLSENNRDRLYGAMISRQEVFETVRDGKRLLLCGQSARELIDKEIDSMNSQLCAWRIILGIGAILSAAIALLIYQYTPATFMVLFITVQIVAEIFCFCFLKKIRNNKDNLITEKCHVHSGHKDWFEINIQVEPAVDAYLQV